MKRKSLKNNKLIPNRPEEHIYALDSILRKVSKNKFKNELQEKEKEKSKINNSSNNLNCSRIKTKRQSITEFDKKYIDEDTEKKENQDLSEAFMNINNLISKCIKEIKVEERNESLRGSSFLSDFNPIKINNKINKQATNKKHRKSIKSNISKFLFKRVESKKSMSMNKSKSFACEKNSFTNSGGDIIKCSDENLLSSLNRNNTNYNKPIEEGIKQIKKSKKNENKNIVVGYRKISSNRNVNNLFEKCESIENKSYNLRKTQTVFSSEPKNKLAKEKFKLNKRKQGQKPNIKKRGTIDFTYKNYIQSPKNYIIRKNQKLTKEGNFIHKKLVSFKPIITSPKGENIKDDISLLGRYPEKSFNTSKEKLKSSTDLNNLKKEAEKTFDKNDKENKNNNKTRNMERRNTMEFHKASKVSFSKRNALSPRPKRSALSPRPKRNALSPRLKRNTKKQIFRGNSEKKVGKKESSNILPLPRNETNKNIKNLYRLSKCSESDSGGVDFFTLKTVQKQIKNTIININKDSILQEIENFDKTEMTEAIAKLPYNNQNITKDANNEKENKENDFDEIQKVKISTKSKFYLQMRTIYFEKLRNLQRKKLIYDSLDDEEFEDQEDNYIYMSPDSFLTYMLDALILVASLIEMIYLPFFLAYNLRFCRDIFSFTQFMFYLIDIIYIVDLISGFFRPFYNFEEILIKKNNLICFNYLEGWFFIDLIQALPFYSFLNYFENSCSLIGQIKNNILIEYSHHYNVNINNLRYIVLLIKSIKIFKVFNQNRVLEKIIYGISGAVSNNWEGIFTVLLCSFGCLNFGSCLFIFFGRNSYPGWIISIGEEDKSFYELYITSIYYLITTITTVGYGDINSYSLLEKYYQIILLLFGTCAYSWIITSVSNYIKKKNEKYIIYENKVKMLKEIKLANQNFSDELYDKIFRHLQFSKKDQHHHGREMIINDLPYTLRNTLIIEMYKPIINNFNFFKSFQNSDFIVRVVMSMKSVFGIKDDIIIQEGDFIEEIIFVKQGVVTLEISLNVNKIKESAEAILTEEGLGKHIENNPSLSKDNFTRNSFSMTRNSISRVNFKLSQIKVLSELNRKTQKRFLKVIDIRKNEHFGDVLMFLNERSPYTVKVRSKKSELFFLKKMDAIEISTTYPNIWKRINQKSLFNMQQIKILTRKVVLMFCDIHGIKISKNLLTESFSFAHEENDNNCKVPVNNFSSSVNNKISEQIIYEDENENLENTMVNSPSIFKDETNSFKTKKEHKSKKYKIDMNKDKNKIKKRKISVDLPNLSKHIGDIFSNTKKSKNDGRSDRIKKFCEKGKTKSLVSNKSFKIFNEKYKISESESSNSSSSSTYKKEKTEKEKKSKRKVPSISNYSSHKNKNNFYSSKDSDTNVKQKKSYSEGSNKNRFKQIRTSHDLVEISKEYSSEDNKDEEKNKSIDEHKSERILFDSHIKLSPFNMTSVCLSDSEININFSRIQNLTPYKDYEINNEVYPNEIFEIILRKNTFVNKPIKRIKEINDKLIKSFLDGGLFLNNNNLFDEDIYREEKGEKEENKISKISDQNKKEIIYDDEKKNKLSSIFTNLSTSKTLSIELDSCYENINKITKNKYIKDINLRKKTKLFLLNECSEQNNQLSKFEMKCPMTPQMIKKNLNLNKHFPSKMRRSVLVDNNISKFSKNSFISPGKLHSSLTKTKGKEDSKNIQSNIVNCSRNNNFDLSHINSNISNFDSSNNNSNFASINGKNNYNRSPSLVKCNSSHSGISQTKTLFKQSEKNDFKKKFFVKTPSKRKNSFINFSQGSIFLHNEKENIKRDKSNKIGASLLPYEKHNMNKKINSKERNDSPGKNKKGKKMLEIISENIFLNQKNLNNPEEFYTGFFKDILEKKGQKNRKISDEKKKSKNEFGTLIENNKKCKIKSQPSFYKTMSKNYDLKRNSTSEI